MGKITPLVSTAGSVPVPGAGDAGKSLVVTAEEDGYELATPAGGGDLLAANNLNDLDNAATARTNLGLGTAATHAHGDYELAGALTKIGEVIGNSSGNAARCISLWILLNPTAGAHTITATQSSAAQAVTAGFAAFTLSDVHQATPTGTAVTSGGAGTSASASTSDATTGDLAVGALALRSTTLPTYTGSGSSLFNSLLATNNPIAGMSEAGDGSSTASWSWSVSDNYAVIVVPIRTATAPSGPTESVGIVSLA